MDTFSYHFGSIYQIDSKKGGTAVYSVWSATKPATDCYQNCYQNDPRDYLVRFWQVKL